MRNMKPMWHGAKPQTAALFPIAHGPTFSPLQIQNSEMKYQIKTELGLLIAEFRNLKDLQAFWNSDRGLALKVIDQFGNVYIVREIK